MIYGHGFLQHAARLGAPTGKWRGRLSLSLPPFSSVCFVQATAARCIYLSMHSLRSTRSTLCDCDTFFRDTALFFAVMLRHNKRAIENFAGIWSIPHAPRGQRCDHDRPLDTRPTIATWNWNERDRECEEISAFRYIAIRLIKSEESIFLKLFLYRGFFVDTLEIFLNKSIYMYIYIFFIYCI